MKLFDYLRGRRDPDHDGKTSPAHVHLHGDTVLPPDQLAHFSSDQPLTDTAFDRLNRAPFARRVAGVLLGLPKGAGHVIGIHGPWGDGKTTVLNFVRSALQHSADTIPVTFNPWRFTDEPAMLAGFFRVLPGTIRARLSTRGEEIARWIETVGRYASVVNDKVGKVADLASTKAGIGLEELRDRLIDALAMADKRIVVLIDDIDRLDKHETYTLFRLIKACADFPNVCYLLAFDDAVVARALGERYGGGDEYAGRAFLEKVIQIPLKLPAAAKEDLRALSFEQIEAALSAAGIELTQEEGGEFVASFDKGVAVRLTTPRAAKRYGNGLLFALPMLKGETNVVDLMLIEACRAFYPEAYDIVRENHTDFSGIESERRAAGAAPSAQLLKPVLDSLPDDQGEALKALLIDLFPRVSGAFGHSTFGSTWLDQWARERRISSPEYCLRYFTYAISRDDVSDTEIGALADVAARGDRAAVESYLTEHLSGRKARRVIEKLRGIETVIDPTAAELIAVTIPKFGNSLPNPPALFGFAEAPTQAAILISHLLRRISDRAKRVAVAKEVIAAADPLWFGAEFVQWLRVTDKPEKQDSNTLTDAETTEIRRVLVDRIKAQVTGEAPAIRLDNSQNLALLFEWQRLEGRDPVQAYLTEQFAKDSTQITTFLQSFAPRAWSGKSAAPRVAEIGADQLKGMKVFIDLDTMAGLIRGHCTGNFDHPAWEMGDARPIEQRLPEQFMYVYNKWKAEGEPPDQKESGSGSGPAPESG